MLYNTQVKYGWRYAITIPDNTGNGTTIDALLTTAGYLGERAAVYIDGIAPGIGGASRAAFMAANARPSAAIAAADFTTHGLYVPAGASYYFPIETDVLNTYLRSLTGSTFTALAYVMM